MAKSREEAKQYLSSIVSEHLPSNARRYSGKVILDEDNISSFGFRYDHPPLSGKVVDIGGNFLAIKLGRNEFAVADLDVLSDIPSVGDVVTITPYARKRFNGKRVDEPVVDGPFKRLVLGETKSYFEVDKKKLVSHYLVDMLTQIEQLQTKDGRRTLAQVFIDAGARTENVKINDCSDDMVFKTPPSVSFSVNTQKFNGEFAIVYDRGSDYYRLEMIQDGVAKQVIDDVDFTQLTDMVVDLIDDGTWRKTAVVVDKPVVKRKMRM